MFILDKEGKPFQAFEITIPSFSRELRGISPKDAIILFIQTNEIKGVSDIMEVDNLASRTDTREEFRIVCGKAVFNIAEKARLITDKHKNLIGALDPEQFKRQYTAPDLAECKVYTIQNGKENIMFETKCFRGYEGAVTETKFGYNVQGIDRRIDHFSASIVSRIEFYNIENV